jgi:DNA mismatch repair protein MutS2
MDKAWKILEIDEIISHVNKYIKTEKGKEILLSLRTYKDREKVILELNKLDEVSKLVLSYNDMPIVSSLSMKAIFELIEKGGVLDEITLNKIKDEITSSIDLSKYFLKIKEPFASIKPLVDNLKPVDALYNAINKAITNDNQVSDNASVKLSQIRRKLYILNADIHKKLTSLMNKYKDKMAGDNFVMRDGRFALPINSSYKSSVSGIVRDLSDSGLTTFIEPLEVIELENEKHLNELEERNEINRILRELTFTVASFKDILTKNNSIIGELDFINSKAKYAREIEASIPKISNRQIVKLYKARHPLLDQKHVVSNDFIIDCKETLMLISGPNAGGKTIALKTVATLAYMIKLGMAIPASIDSEIGFFNHIYVDIGDDQSIEENLSTFSAHISNLSVIFQYLNSRDLVVIDEVGNGTDPKEGEALAIAVTKYLIEKRCVSLITSHYDLLKKFGLSNEKILTASFLFNEKKIEPTYKMMLGVGGKSYGFLIAKKYGFKDEIINDAMNIYNKNYMTKEDLRIRNLENKEINLKEREEEIKTKEIVLQNKIDENAKQEELLREKSQKLKDKKLEELDAYIDKKYDEIEDIYSDFLKNRDIKKTEARIEAMNKKVQKEPLKIGDFVIISALNSRGQITRINGNKLTLNTDSGMSVNIDKSKVELTNKPSLPTKETRDIDMEIINQKSVSSSLNLVGYHIDEGIESLSRYLDDCSIRHLKVVKVIHGYGTGKLRQAIHNYLKTSRYVASFRLGNDIDGGTGATIITLK